jgi:hypothetical protein
MSARPRHDLNAAPYIFGAIEALRDIRRGAIQPCTRHAVQIPRSGASHQVVGKRGGPANSGRREWTAVGASLSQLSEIGVPDSVTSSGPAGTVWTESGSSLVSEVELISNR